MQVHNVKPFYAVTGATRCSDTEHQFRAVYPAMAFMYRQRLDPQRLARTLAQVLSDFPWCAGKLSSRPDGLYIEHGAGGSTLEVVERSTSIDRLFERAAKTHRYTLLCHRISPLRAALGQEPLLAVRLTRTPDGSALGVVWNHIIGDLHSMMLFMRAWALAYQGRAYETVFPVADRDAYLSAHMPDPPAARAGLCLASWRELSAFYRAITRPSRRVNLDYSAEQLSAIATSLRTSAHVRSLPALSAHVFSVIRHLQGTSDPISLCLSVDLRRRLGLPSQVFGNLVTVVAQPTRANETAADIAVGLRTRLEQFATQHADYHATRRVLARLSPRERKRVLARDVRPERGNLLVTSWANFGAYELVFDRLAPEQFLCLSVLPAGFAVIYELPKRAGLRLSVALPPELAKRLESSSNRALLHPRAARTAPDGLRQRLRGALRSKISAPTLVGES